MTRINRAGYHRAERHRAAVIKIRYRDVNELSPGLHPMAERRGRVITVYVIPGLTAAERNATLRRLRLSGRRGYGPRLPAVPLAFARFADRIRTTVARAGSVFRTHPAGATGPVMLMSAGAIAFLVLSAVSVRILREPRAPAGPSASSLAPATSAMAPHHRRSSRQLADDPGGSGDRVLTTAQTGPDPLPPVTTPDLPSTGSGAGADAGSTAAPSVSASVPVPVATTAPVGVSVSAAAAVSASLPVPGSAAAGSPAPAQSPAVAATVTVGACLDVGPTGICLGG
jgi:hypothetical protein